MLIHKGEILENAVRKTEFPIKLLAKRLGKSRRHIYHLFERREISVDVLIEVGKIIQYDFSNDFADLANIQKDFKVEELSDSKGTYESLEYWKAKYYDLLERHELLLTNKLKEFIKKK